MTTSRALVRRVLTASPPATLPVPPPESWPRDAHILLLMVITRIVARTFGSADDRRIEPFVHEISSNGLPPDVTRSALVGYLRGVLGQVDELKGLDDPKVVPIVQIYLVRALVARAGLTSTDVEALLDSAEDLARSALNPSEEVIGRRM